MKKIFKEVEELLKSKGIESAIQIVKKYDNFGKNQAEEDKYSYVVYVSKCEPSFYESLVGFKECVEKLRIKLKEKQKNEYSIQLIRNSSVVGSGKITKKQLDKIKKELK